MLFNDLNKTYFAVIRFGQETTTCDLEGEIITEAPVPVFDKIKSISESFIGTIKQVPPAYSAVKINGQRAYSLARKGEIIDIPERTVIIHDLKIKRWVSPDLFVEVTCSSGTYIRSLARDLALASGSRAYVHSLKRISIGPFSLSQAVNPQLFQDDNIQPAEDFIKSFNNVACINVSKEVCKKVSFGQQIQPEILDLEMKPKTGYVGLFSINDLLIAVLKRKDVDKIKESECNNYNPDSVWNYMCVLRN